MAPLVLFSIKVPVMIPLIRENDSPPEMEKEKGMVAAAYGADPGTTSDVNEVDASESEKYSRTIAKSVSLRRLFE